jgi:hypothetical protein
MSLFWEADDLPYDTRMNCISFLIAHCDRRHFVTQVMIYIYNELRPLQNISLYHLPK